MRKLLVLVVLLQGCITSAEYADRLADRYGPACEKLGTKQGTPEYAQCVLKLREMEATGRL